MSQTVILKQWSHVRIQKALKNGALSRDWEHIKIKLARWCAVMTICAIRKLQCIDCYQL